MSKINDSILKEFHFEKTGKFITEEEFKRKKHIIKKQQLIELLDIEDSDKYDVEKSGDDFYKKLQIKSETFEVDIIPSKSFPDFWIFSFKLIYSPYVEKPPKPTDEKELKPYINKLQDYQFGTTNSGNPIEVLKIMKSVLYRFIKTYKISGVMIKDYDEGTRSKIYNYIANDVSKKSGYKLLNLHHYFILIQDEEIYNQLKSDYK